MREVEDDFAWIRPVDNFLECRLLWRSGLCNRLRRVGLDIRRVGLGVIDEAHYIVTRSNAMTGWSVVWLGDGPSSDVTIVRRSQKSDNQT